MNKFLSLVLCCLGILAINGLAICQNADVATIFHNGKIFTADAHGAVVQSVAIRHDKIIATGTLDEVRKMVGKPVKLVDLMGHTMLPGLVDSHNHAIGGGRSLMTAHLNDFFVAGDSLAAYAQYAISSGRGLRGDVLFIQGFHSNTWKDIRMLESIFDDSSYAGRAVALKGSDGHTAWVNKTMLKRAGITSELIASLPEADQQYFGVTSSGEPNGLISESGFSLIDKVLPSSAIKSRDALSEAVRHLNMLGITAWMDPSAGNVEDGMANDMLLAYKDISAVHALTAHVTTIIRGDGNAPVAPQIAVVKTWKEKLASSNNVSVVGFKIFADGVMEFPTQTASMSAPYKNSGLRGSRMVDPEKFKAFAVAADKEHLLVHVHAIGDLAVTDALNAIAAARIENKNSDIPHSITHLQCVSTTDLERFSKLNVLACMQMLWATADIYTDELVKPYIDETAYAYMYPAHSIQQHGGLVCGASDWPVSSANPFEAIYIAESRRGNAGVLNDKEIMKRMDMLNAYTINSAKAILRDKSIGSIEPGKQADFVLVDRDVLTVSSQEVKNTKVLWTMFDGKIVYQMPAK